MGFFEWSDEEQQGEFTLIPEQDLIVCMRKGEEKDTKKCDGKYINAEFSIEALGSGEVKYAGRKLWHIFNVENPSQTAQNIGRGQLSALASNFGFSKDNPPPSIDALLDQPFKIRVGIRYSKFKEKDENYIKTFYKPKAAPVVQNFVAPEQTEEVPEYSGTKPSFSAGK